MLAKVFSAAVYGVDAFEVEIEVNAGSGNSVIVVVGLPDVAVKESKDRVTTAISNSGYRWPRGRTTINFAPADVKKEGPSFDIPALSSLEQPCAALYLPRRGALKCVTSSDSGPVAGSPNPGREGAPRVPKLLTPLQMRRNARRAFPTLGLIAGDRRRHPSVGFSLRLIHLNSP